MVFKATLLLLLWFKKKVGYFQGFVLLLWFKKKVGFCFVQGFFLLYGSIRRRALRSSGKLCDSTQREGLPSEPKGLGFRAAKPELRYLDTESQSKKSDTEGHGPQTQNTEPKPPKTSKPRHPRQKARSTFPSLTAYPYYSAAVLRRVAEFDGALAQLALLVSEYKVQGC